MPRVLLGFGVLVCVACGAAHRGEQSVGARRHGDDRHPADASADAAHDAADAGTREHPDAATMHPSDAGDADANEPSHDAGGQDAGRDAARESGSEVCDDRDNDGDGQIDENSYVCFHDAPADSIDALITRCPSAAAIAAIDADLDLRYEHGPLAVGDEIVCTAAQSGRPLTHLQERVYQALIAMRALHFDRALPWTNLGLYEWFVQTVRGIRFRDDIGVSQCCNAPENRSGPYINIAVGGSSAVFATDLWASVNGGLYTAVTLFTHEARHVAVGHSCGTSDTSISELGAWGVEYYLYSYLAHHADACFLRPTLPASSKYPAQATGETDYLKLMRDEASRVQKIRFCSEPSFPLAPPTPLRACHRACAAAPERCNLVDDDCDGKIDEDVIGTSCGVDTGECSVGTVTRCETGLEECSGQRPSAEKCDGLDNDCDGTADAAGCAACAGTSGQSYDGSLVLQSHADAAQIAGIGCVTGTLHIMSSFADLSDFSQLQAVGGDLWILGNRPLKELAGLGSLRHVGRLFIENNPELVSLRGLEGLTSIDTYHLMITGNPKLRNLDGLSALATIKSQLIIEQNTALENIDGLSALTQVGGGVYVRNNPVLPACRVEKFMSAHTLTCADCSGNSGTASCAP
jgi:Putative metal-binding motif